VIGELTSELLPGNLGRLHRAYTHRGGEHVVTLNQLLAVLFARWWYDSQSAGACRVDGSSAPCSNLANLNTWVLPFLTAICLILKIGTDNLLRRVRAVPTRAAKMRALCSGTDGVYVLV
jgi:hypothetical protein